MCQMCPARLSQFVSRVSSCLLVSLNNDKHSPTTGRDSPPRAHPRRASAVRLCFAEFSRIRGSARRFTVSSARFGCFSCVTRPPLLTTPVQPQSITPLTQPALTNPVNGQMEGLRDDFSAQWIFGSSRMFDV